MPRACPRARFALASTAVGAVERAASRRASSGVAGMRSRSTRRSRQGSPPRNARSWRSASRRARATEAHVLNLYFRRAVRRRDDRSDVPRNARVVSDLPPFERPIVTAHEWAHLAGYNDEGEANFVGWLSCMRGDEAASVQRVGLPVQRSGQPVAARRSAATGAAAGCGSARGSARDRRPRGAQSECPRCAGGLAGATTSICTPTASSRERPATAR